MTDPTLQERAATPVPKPDPAAGKDTGSPARERHDDLEIDTESVAGEEDPGASIETLVDPPPEPGAPGSKRP